MAKIEEQRQPKKDSIAIIYHQKNDSPKYFEIKRSKVLLFFIGLPAITLASLVIGAVGVINTSPFHIIESYRQNREMRSEMAAQKEMQDQVDTLMHENSKLKEQIENSKVTQVPADPKTPTEPGKCPAPVTCPSPTTLSPAANSIGLSMLSLFKPIQGQRDKTRPAVLNLSGFKTVTTPSSVNLQFNIIPSATSSEEAKISGHIVVLMKNDVSIEAYPAQALAGNDFQINYSSGEPFATQRFRPVDAGFAKPRKAGTYSFTVFIFSRTGDLIHFQTIALPVKL